MFGTDVKVGLRSNTLPTEILEIIITEDDLITAYATPPEDQETAESET